MLGGIAVLCAQWLAVAPPQEPAKSAPAPTRVDTRIERSIEVSLVRVVGQPGRALAAQVARLLGWRGDIVRNVQRDDVLRLLYEPGDPPSLLALRYQGAEIQLEAYRFPGDDGVDRFYDATGTLVEPALVNAPVQYLQITEVPQHGSGKRKHTGIDLKAELGTPVVMPFEGVVVRVNWTPRVNGNCVEVRFASGYVGRFLHLSEVDAKVAPEVHLVAGDRLGAVGSTGHSIGPHLHYEVRSATGDVLDPLQIHGRAPVVLAAERMATFTARRQTLDHLIEGAGL